MGGGGDADPLGEFFWADFLGRISQAKSLSNPEVSKSQRIQRPELWSLTESGTQRAKGPESAAEDTELGDGRLLLEQRLKSAGPISGGPA